ncbi:MAG: class I SAM-dependent methyltransferase [Gammaproteobacteria bacterium]
MFFPSLLGIFINPFYFSRKGLARSLSLLAPQVTGKVLDVGCGNKPYRDLYRADEYVGLEIDTPENRAAKAADYYYQGDTFPFDSQTFDSVVSNQVFEHVPDPDRFLNEISRVLRDDGMLLITAPFVWDEHEQPHDYTRYSSFGMISILNRHGFEVLELRKSVDDIRMVFQLLGAYIYKRTLTGSRIVNLFLTVLLIAPVNITGEIVSWITPRNPDLYLDNIVLARKQS